MTCVTLRRSRESFASFAATDLFRARCRSRGGVLQRPNEEKICFAFQGRLFCFVFWEGFSHDRTKSWFLWKDDAVTAAGGRRLDTPWVILVLVL